MSNHKNDLLSLHPVSVVGSLMGARPQQAHAAPQHAEPEASERRVSSFRRLTGAYRARRAAAAQAQTRGA
jgi:hypothetical protein